MKNTEEEEKMVVMMVRGKGENMRYERMVKDNRKR